MDAERHFREAVRLDTSDFLSLFKVVKAILDHSSAQSRERLLEGVEMYEICKYNLRIRTSSLSSIFNYS